jgi:hypothetical protein
MSFLRTPASTLIATLALLAAACGPVDPATETGGGSTAPGDTADTRSPAGADEGNQDPVTPPDTPSDEVGGEAGSDAGAGGDAGTDPFGVTKIYPSLPGGEEWYLSDDPSNDPRFDPQETITQNDDGSWKMTSNKVRMNVFTSTGYDPGQIETYDRDELVAKGYMQAPNDWKNVEITGFVKVNAADDMTDNFAWYARGGRHNDELACEGSAYKSDLHFDGTVRWAKESYHVSYDHFEEDTATEPLEGRWVGWKAVIRNVEQDGQTVVKLESYLNDNGDGVTWEKVQEFVDDGTMMGDHSGCGASNPTVAMTWGGPTATFRWDSATDVDFKWMSVREIQP